MKVQVNREMEMICDTTTIELALKERVRAYNHVIESFENWGEDTEVAKKELEKAENMLKKLKGNHAIYVELIGGAE